MSLILSGIPLRDKIKDELKSFVVSLPKEQIPKLCIIQVGSNESSSLYIKGKIKFGEEIGVPVSLHHLNESDSEEDLIKLILKQNLDAEVRGIIVQFPLPSHINKDRIVETIDPQKDVDGLHSKNLKKLFTNDSSGIIPATTRGIFSLLDFYNIPLKGKRVLVIGRSDLVGKPTAILALNKNAIVTIAHSHASDLVSLCREADIIISATGIPGLITKKHVKKHQIIIDVGISRIGNKVVGDVDEKVLSSVAGLSPVPGGIGPLTIASLFQNLLR